jgi:hypothetical protein
LHGAAERVGLTEDSPPTRQPRAPMPKPDKAAPRAASRLRAKSPPHVGKS